MIFRHSDYNYLTADVSHILIFHWKWSLQVTRYVPPISWILTLDKPFLCHCPKSADKGSTGNIHQSLRIASLFLKAKNSSFVSVKIWKLLFLAKESLSLNHLCTACRLCKNAKERVREFSDAPTTPPHLLLHTHPLPPNPAQLLVTACYLFPRWPSIDQKDGSLPFYCLTNLKLPLKNHWKNIGCNGCRTKSYCKTIGTNGWWSYWETIITISSFDQWLAIIKKQINKILHEQKTIDRSIVLTKLTIVMV